MLFCNVEGSNRKCRVLTKSPKGRSSDPRLCGYLHTKPLLEKILGVIKPKVIVRVYQSGNLLKDLQIWLLFSVKSGEG